jgi:hypothetical protein
MKFAGLDDVSMARQLAGKRAWLHPVSSYEDDWQEMWSASLSLLSPADITVPCRESSFEASMG